MEQDMNEPFSLALSVPRNTELSVAFSPMVIEAGIFPINSNNKTMHATIVTELTNMMCNAINPYFEVTVKIQNSICLIVENNHKYDATGIEFFHFLVSQYPNNNNVPTIFAAAC